MNALKSMILNVVRIERLLSTLTSVWAPNMSQIYLSTHSSQTRYACNILFVWYDWSSNQQGYFLLFSGCAPQSWCLACFKRSTHICFSWINQIDSLWHVMFDEWTALVSKGQRKRGAVELQYTRKDVSQFINLCEMWTIDKNAYGVNVLLHTRRTPTPTAQHHHSVPLPVPAVQMHSRTLSRFVIIHKMVDWFEIVCGDNSVMGLHWRCDRTTEATNCSLIHEHWLRCTRANVIVSWWFDW